MADARKYPRYPAKRGVLALLAVPRELTARIGELVDLSEGGLAFVYSGDNDPYTGPAEVEVFGFEPPESVIGKVRCRVVYEKTLERSPLTGTETRRCGLEFDASLRDVANRLRAFIAANAKEPVQLQELHRLHSR
jgi:hypothetical protein